MTVEEKKIVSHLIDVCDDARCFYRDAAEKIENSEIERTFEDNAALRDGIIVNLQDYMRKKGEKVEADGTMSGKAEALFGHLAASVTPDTDKALVSQLEEAEDKALEEFHKAMAKNITPELRERLSGYVGKLRYTHDRMKALQDRLAA